ncbi:unnamed protein product [Didymodactylos carnosus]|uniref:Uncharacterized protein n=1 Tax=Didymodactylos carnosus TaxID=1234261 RepID=A0A814SYQ7_9BILA|nr:unnamed protein product [Didymodactylos carnosus]CAF3916328.1 unnamed protein product [Didymodactylos carnosus]
MSDEKEMVLKVLHQYLDECKVAFVAIANKVFDPANANRMICVYRSLPSKKDQEILAYGCLVLVNENKNSDDLKNIIFCLCLGYRRVLDCDAIPKIFHDRDFIYMLRELRFGPRSTATYSDATVDEITPESSLCALQDNFNGIKYDEFKQLTEIFFKAIQEKCPIFELPTNNSERNVYRDVTTILRESMPLTSIHRRLYGRYKLIIDESEDESVVRLLFQTKILDPNRTTIFRLSDFPDDVDNELRNVEILSTIKLCIEIGKTILMVNTGCIHGSLYDVFNQNFSIMATSDTRKIFSKVAIGPKTPDVVVHEDFQCIVHINRSEINEVTAPFLSRFQKYSFSIQDFYRIQFRQLSMDDQTCLKNVEEKLKSFIEHFSSKNFCGLNNNTLYSCLLSMIENDENGHCGVANVHHQYTQLTIKTKSFIEENPINIQKCLLRSVLAKLMQLVSPGSIIFKLPTFEDKIARLLCNNYFRQQEHFSLENFIRQLVTKSLSETQNDDGETMNRTTDESSRAKNVLITTKVMIYTRTSSYVMSLNKLSKFRLLGNNNNADYEIISGMTNILSLTVSENAAELEQKLHAYEQDRDKHVLIIVINARLTQQRRNIPFDNNKNSPSPNQGTFQIATQCSCIPQTPLYQVFHQRIKLLADEVKQD